MTDDYEPGEDAQTAGERYFIPDEVVDRIYDAAHILPASSGIVHAVWHRKAFIGRALQQLCVCRDRGVTREDLAGEWYPNGRSDEERFEAEMTRLRELIMTEVYGPEN